MGVFVSNDHMSVAWFDLAKLGVFTLNMYIIYLLGLVLEELVTIFPPIWVFLMSNLIRTHWELERNMLGTKEKWIDGLQTNICHYIPLILWCLGVCSSWVGHMETGPYACPLKTSLMQWPRTCTFTKWRMWAQCKARVELGVAPCTPRCQGFFSFGRGQGMWVFAFLFWVRGTIMSPFLSYFGSWVAFCVITHFMALFHMQGGVKVQK